MKIFLLVSLIALPGTAKERKTDVLAAKGTALVASGKNQEALDFLDRALKLDSKNAAAYANRHTARYRLKDFNGAVSDFDRAVALDPKLKSALAGSAGDAHYQRALLKIDRGDAKAAAEDLYAAVKLDRKNALAYAELGYLALKAGQPQDALGYLDRAILLKPDFAQAYANRAAVHQSLGEDSLMESDKKKALELSSVGKKPE